MLKAVLRNRLFLVGLLFFVLIVVGSVFYLKPVEHETAERMNPLTETQKPTTEAPVGDTSQDRHSHADRTLPAEPPQTSELPNVLPELQQYAQHIPAHLLEAQRLVSVDMARSKAAFRAALPEDPFSAEFEKAVKDAVQTLLDLHPGIYDLPPGHLHRVQSAIAHNLLLVASEVAGRLHRRYDDPSSVARAKEIFSWEESYNALFTNTTQHEEKKNR